MTLKILVLDDEEIIRNGITNKLYRLLPEKVLVKKAQNAHEGLELLKTYNPHIVLTDIRMPETDGLDFISIARKIYGDKIKFIIISGYEDFGFARSAIKLGVEDYLLKPINNDKLKEIILNLELKIKKETQKELLFSDLRHKANKSTQLIRNKFLTDITNYSNDFDISYILKNLKTIGIEFEKNLFTVANITLSGYLENSRFSACEDLPLAKFAIINIIEEILANSMACTVFENTRNEKQIMVILNHDHPLDKKELLKYGKQVLDAVNQFLKISLVIGVGRSYQSAKELPLSYIDSCTAVMQRILLGDNRIITYDDISDSERITIILKNDRIINLTHYIHQGNRQKVFEILDEIKVTILANSLSYNNIKFIYLELIIILDKIVKEAGGNWNKIFSEDVTAEDYLAKHLTLDSLFTKMKTHIDKICSYLNDLKKINGTSVIDEIKDYMNHYYYTLISLKSMAEKYYINPSYLSQLFKNETGENFIDYLTNIRIKKAADLLNTTSFKSYEIASMVGYGNPRHFSDQFKRITGLTPKNYRVKQRIAGNET